MKILHIRASNFYGGPERQLHFHAKLANKEQVAVTVASFNENNQTPEFLRVIGDANLPVYAFPAGSSYDFSVVKKIRTYLEENKFDIICTHDYRSHLMGMLAKRKTACKWIAFSRGYTSENLKVRLFHWVEKLIIRYADKIVAVSESQKKKLTVLGMAPDKITVAHNAIDLTIFEALPAENLRDEYQLDSLAVICLAGGRFSQEKGQSYLVEAAISLCQKNNNLYFFLYGDGPDREGLIQQIEALQLSNRIFCPGFDKALPNKLKNADILVNPSLSEGLPNIVLEAMALGVPVIATNIGGHPELITDSKSGFLVPPADSKKLADKIQILVDNVDKRQQFADTGKETIKNHFTFVQQNSILVALYKEILLA